MARAATTEDAFNAVAEPRRRQILDLLAAGERPVNDLVGLLGLAQPQVSKHLRVLREVGLVEVRDEGRQRMYRVNGTPLKPIPGLDLEPIGKEETLVGMLREGKLDALFTARGPSSFLRGEPHIKRLFANTREAEQSYYKKTRMFPIMHLVGIRKELVQKYPWLPTSVYKAFCEAKALAMIDLLDVNALMVSLPWLIPETEDTMAVMGKDFWAYGIEENMREISALAQYLHEQGLIDRKVTVEELFHPSMFEISKV